MKGIDPREESYIVDSCGWIDYLSDSHLAQKYSRFIENATPETAFTPTIVIYEVFKKVLIQHGEEEAGRTVAHIKAISTTIDLTGPIAVSAASISHQERIPMADAIILASARYYDLKLITSDTDLEGQDGVIFIS